MSDAVHEGEVFEDPIAKYEAPAPDDVDWGPRPPKSARSFRADGNRVGLGTHRTAITLKGLDKRAEVFLRRLAAWLGSRAVLNKLGGAGRGTIDVPGYAQAVEYMISAYGAMLDAEMRKAGVDPETGEHLALPEVTG